MSSSTTSKYTICSKCKKRIGVITWGDTLAMTHGFTTMRCNTCAYRDQILYALKAIKRLPPLLIKLIWAEITFT